MIGRYLAATALLGLSLGAHRTGPAVVLTSSGPMPEAAAYRFAGEGQGEQPGDFLVRSVVEKQLQAKGFRQSDKAARYVVEVAVSARPNNVGAFQGAPDSRVWLDAPAAKGAGFGSDHVCAVRVRFIDAATGAETWRANAQQHAPAADCNTENWRLVDAAMGTVAAKR